MKRTPSQPDPRPPQLSAIIVGVLVGTEDPSSLDEDLDELESLLKTLHIRTVSRVIQRRQRLSAHCLIGEGKVEEIREMAADSGASMVVFDRPLTPPQVRNLEEMTCCEVTDRTGVILDIFVQHARTNQAKTQVEIAKLEYLLPRMTGAWTHFQRQRGGGINRGMGEKQIEVDRRRARERIARLSKQLEVYRKEKQNQRKQRQNELKVALVGYTNSGKTSLMNAMTRAHLEAQDVLFATLEASVRMLDPSTRPKILLSDTVGFIRNLPHGLVESFKSTLDEVLEADMLLHVVDVSHRNYNAHMETTQSVLEEIGAGDIPTIVVFNKLDKLDDPMLPRILKQVHKGCICVSAYRDDDVVKLRKHIFNYFEQTMRQVRLILPSDDQPAMAEVYGRCLILESEFHEDGRAEFLIRATEPVINRLKRYVTDETPKESPHDVHSS